MLFIFKPNKVWRIQKVSFDSYFIQFCNAFTWKKTSKVSLLTE